LAPTRSNGWLLLAHPHFEDEYSKWQNDAVKVITKNPTDFASHSKVKLFATLQKLVFEVIPEDPARESFLLGNTLGPENRAWRRAKFSQQYRLFFRFDSAAKIIIYAWVNDANSLRAYQSKTDAYAMFAKRLHNGNPPNNWDELLSESTELSAN
jgi:toxin YhaV